MVCINHKTTIPHALKPSQYAAPINRAVLATKLASAVPGLVLAV
jgi:hypothetical protein